MKSEKTLAVIRDTLLPKLISGEIRATNKARKEMLDKRLDG